MEQHQDIYTRKIINLIVRRRKEVGLSQIGLAERSGLPQSTIARIETHRLHMRLDTLMKILAVLDCDLSFASNETIETKRLILRKLTMDDAGAMFDGWCSDPDVAKYVTWNPHKSIDETKSILSSWIKEYDSPDSIRYGICLKNSGKLIGTIDVVDYINENPEIGYCLAKGYWNNGYMTEALKAFVSHLFRIGFNSIVIEADVRNIASNRVIEKSGFKFMGKESKDHWSPFKAEPITVNWYQISF